MGLKNKKFYTWAFKAIKAIVDGDSVNRDDMNDYTKSMKIFAVRNPELLLPELFKPRSSVYIEENWSTGVNVPSVLLANLLD